MTDNSRASLVADLSLRTLSRAALGCVLGVTLLAAAVPARAGDADGDNNENVPLDTKIIRGFMEQLGLRQDGPGIAYGERPPLVIPPNHDLPPPEKSDAVVSHNPAWPVDPDVKRAKQEAALRRRTTMNPDAILQAEQSPLRPDQIAPGPKPQSRRIGDDGYRPSPNGSGAQLPPNQLNTSPNFFGKMFGKDTPETSSFVGEPPRTALTEPPPGYQTPSPDQPYGVGKAKPHVDTPQDYIMNHPVGTD
jgi:hypothetical protein